MNRSLDVLHVIDQLAPGGAERNLLAMVRELKALGIRSHVAWLYGRGGLEDEFRRHAETLIPLEVRSRAALAPALFRLARQARALSLDVVHGQLLVAHLAARMVARVCQRPCVTTWQNVIYEDGALGDFGGSRRLRALFRSVDWLSSSRHAHYVAVSDYVRNTWSRSVGVPLASVHVIPNVVELERCREVSTGERSAWRARLQIPAQSEIIVSAGRLVLAKGHGEAIAAMRQIAVARPNALLLIAGSGPAEAQLRARIAEAGMERHVRLLGYQAEMAPIYALASLFLFATHTEGLPLTLGEALGAGLPAALSDIAPNRAMAGQLASVRYFPVGNVSALAKAVIDLLGGVGHARAAAMAASSEIRQRYAPAHVAHQLADLFAVVADERQRVPHS